LAATAALKINGTSVVTITITSWRRAIRNDPYGVSLSVLTGVAVPLAVFGKAVMAVSLP